MLLSNNKRIIAFLLAVLTITGGSSYFSFIDSSITASAEVVQLSYDETEAAITDILNPRPDATSPQQLAFNSETGQYRDGTYTVPVYAYSHYQTTDAGTDASMANGALEHNAVLEIKDGIASLTLSFNAITLDLGNGQVQGHLCDLWYYDVNNIKQTITNKVFDYAYEKGDLSKPYSIIDTATIPLNNCTNQYYDDANQKPIFPSDIICRVDVDAMGDVQQDCNIVIDWNNLQCSYWNDKVVPFIEECELISNENGTYSDESYNTFVETLQSVKNSALKYDISAANACLVNLKKAKNNLIVQNDVLKNGIYSASVKFYYIDEEPLTYDDGVAFSNVYSVSENEVAFLSEFFGDKVNITSEDGVYTLSFNPVVDNTSEYYVATVANLSFGTTQWTKITKTTSAVTYGSKTKKFITSANSVTGIIKNRYGAESLLCTVTTYPTDASATTGTKTYFAVGIDWDNIEYVSALPTDKSALETQIGSTNNLINKNLLTAYTDSSVNNLKSVLADAEAVNNSDESTQAEIDDAVAALKAATSALVKKPTLDGYTGVLSDYVGLKFQFQMASTLAESNPTVQFEIAGETSDAEIEVVSTDDNGMATCTFIAKLDAKQMTDVVTADIVVGEETVATFTGCVKDYAETIIKNADGSYSDKAIAAAKALLNYGGYSQTLFGYNTDNLANASIDTDVSSVTSATLANYKPTMTGSDATAKFTGYNLYLDSLTSMRLYYTGDAEASANAEHSTTVKSGSKNYVEITDITPTNLLNGYDVTIGGMTVHASPASYAHTALTKSSDKNLQNAMKAMILYSQAAAAYDATVNN